MAWWTNKTEKEPDPGATVLLPRSRSGFLLQGEALADLLQRASLASRPILIVLPDKGEALTGQLVACNRDSLTCTVVVGGTASAPMAMCMVCISFALEAQSFAFLTIVRDCKTEVGVLVGSIQLILDLPSQIIGAEARRAVRIPVRYRSGLSVKVVTADEKTWTPQPLDISKCGILLSFSTKKDPFWAVGTEFTVELGLADNRVQMQGVVQHRKEGRYGIFFPETMHRGEVTPPALYQAIFTLLERDDLRTLR